MRTVLALVLCALGASTLCRAQESVAEDLAEVDAAIMEAVEGAPPSSPASAESDPQFTAELEAAMEEALREQVSEIERAILQALVGHEGPFRDAESAVLRRMAAELDRELDRLERELPHGAVSTQQFESPMPAWVRSPADARQYLAGQQAAALVMQGQALLDLDFSDEDLDLEQAGLRLLPSNLPSTGIADVPHRQTRALVRDLGVQPENDDGSLNIAANEVGQGLQRLFAEGVPLDHREQALVLRLRVFSDAALAGTNSIAVRLWAQNGFGPNQHHERMELSAHFTSNPRGARQVYPNAYWVREGWETWAMPEGSNGRRAGIYYRLGAEGRGDEIRGPEAVPRGHYWTWQGLDWPRGWAPPLGAGLYAPDTLPDSLDTSYTITAVFRRDAQPLSDLPFAFRTAVDVAAPRAEGRVLLDSPLPERIQEVRLILRSELPHPERGWPAQLALLDGQSPQLGVEQASVQLMARADATLDGHVDEQDWQVLQAHFGPDDGLLHFSGDASGDGRVDLDDAFVMARQWSAADAWDDPDPSQWWAQIDAAGHLQLHLPARSQLLAWQVLDAPAGWQAPSLLGQGAVRAADGEAHLTAPMAIADGQRMDLGLVSAEVTHLRIRLQTHRGRPALTLLASRQQP